MGSIRKYKNQFRAEVCVKSLRESRIFPTKSEAKEWVSQRESYLAEMKTGKTARIQFSELCRLWAERYPNRTQYHWEVTRLKHLCDYGTGWLGAISLTNLNSKAVAEWRDERLKVNGNGTVTRDFNLLAKVVTDAVKEMKLMEINPFKEVKRPTSPPPRDRVVSDAEIELLKIAATGIQAQKALRAFLISVETGLSAGELCNLQYEWIKGRVVFLPTFKTRPARQVPLSSEAITLIGDGEGAVVGLNRAQLDANWRKLKNKATVEGLNFHDARATAATRLSKKLDPLALAKVLGHSDLKMLIEVYYRPDAKDLAELLR
jgi:integrase